MPQTPRQTPDDIMFVDDRRREPRIIVSISARYALANRRDSRGKRREFACRVVDISLHAMTLVVPVNGAIGERIITQCDEFGRLEGSVTRLLDRGFVMMINATDEERARLAAKIDWYEQNKNHDISDGREHKRIISKDPRSTIILGDKTRLECFIIDMSVSGVAVSADIQPAIGTPLAVGRLVGRVVRHFADGFAVHFIKLQELDGLEQRLTLSDLSL